MFRWGVENEIVGAMIVTALAAIAPLMRGRSEAVESDNVCPAAAEDVDAVRPFVSGEVWAMIQTQLRTGMRPGEVCVMRMKDIKFEKDAAGREKWTYTPSTHKNTWRGKSRKIPIGPKCQEILQPFITAGTEDYFFSPERAEEARNAAKLKNPEKAKARRARKRLRPWGKRYTVAGYRRAIERGCRKAGVKRWHPHQLRHTFGTMVREERGAEAAQVALGHSTLDATMIYAERNEKLLQEIAAAVG